MNNNKLTSCQNCGAPATTEVCNYCKGVTGIDKKYIKLEYPILECKETNFILNKIIGKLISGILLILLGAFTLVVLPLFDSIEIGFIGMAILIYGLYLFNVGITPIIRNIKLKKYGKEIDAIVYGYMKDEFKVNDHVTQIVKLLIDTKNGKKFILYQLEKNKQPYKLKSKIKLLMYNDIYKILDKEKYYF